MAIVKHAWKDIIKPLTQEEINELEEAEKKQIVYDEDCPRLTAEQLAQFKRVNEFNRRKKTISIRLNPRTIEKAKMYSDKGYTSLLSRLLDLAIDDEEMIKKCL